MLPVHRHCHILPILAFWKEGKTRDFKMLSFCVFRRYGIVVPILFFLIGFILDRSSSAKYGESHYYFTSYSLIGINLLVTGVLTALVACVVDPPPSNDYVYSAIRDLDVEDISRNVKDSLEHFVYDETEEDMFCYVPLNRCALALVAIGILLIFAGMLFD